MDNKNKDQKPEKNLVDLAKILGLDKEFLDYLASDFFKEPPGKKFEITRILWEQYLKLKQLLTEKFYQDLLNEAMLG
ncbi:MAG: hypothetical protein N3E37_05865, partial [Candidatus Micrarchaeota archaeon]|nr:hypothetical protein [Candidatus Micrarchaeota archaeon]